MYDGSKSFEQEVDGDRRKRTNRAIEKAKAAGYYVDEATGYVGRTPVNHGGRPTVQTNQQASQIIDPYTGMPTSIDIGYGDSNLGNGYSKTQDVSSETTRVNPVRMIFDPTYSSNIPFFTALGDLTVSTANRIYRNISGKGTDSYLFKNPDISDIPDDQKQILIDFYKEKRNKTGTNPTAFTSKDWRNFQGNYTGGNRSLIERAFLPSALSALEHSLGQWNYYQDEDGNVHAVDTYDWNDGETSANQGSYTTARDFMGKYGTKASETAAQRNKNGKSAARKMDINLGKI